MSVYTTEVRFICEQLGGLKSQGNYSDVKKCIELAAPQIFEPFPLFDENYRLSLESKILMHYYTREIADETMGLWKLRLNTRMNEIMPYYNQLYKSQLLEFNPLYDVDLTRDRTVDTKGTQELVSSDTQDTTTDTTTHDESQAKGKTISLDDSETGVVTEGTSVGDSRNSNKHYDVFSDTPQGSLSGIESERYLTNARKITDDDDGSTNTKTTGDSTTTHHDDLQTTVDNTATANGNANIKGHARGTAQASTDITNLEDYIEHVKGKQGTATYSAMLNEFRSTFLNIDLQIIEELADLFFNLY